VVAERLLPQQEELAAAEVDRAVSLLGGGEQTGPQGDDGKVSMGAYCVMIKVVEMEDL
jgi:hypothetical protein